MASLAKMHNAARARAVVGEARDLLGGTGLLLEYDVARHLGDVEVTATVEGTDVVHALIVGREITGISAFSWSSPVRAAVYQGQGRITLEERPDPVAGLGELVVRVRAWRPCGSDLMAWYQDPRPGAGARAGGRGGAGRRGRPVRHRRARVRASPRPVHDLRPAAGRHTLCLAFRRTRIDPGGLAQLGAGGERPRRRPRPARHAGPDWAATLIEPLACAPRPARQGARRARVARRRRAPARWGCWRSEPPGRRARLRSPPWRRADRRALAEAAGATALAARSWTECAALGGGPPTRSLSVQPTGRRSPRLPLAGLGGVVQLFAPTLPGELVGARPRVGLLPRGEHPVDLLRWALRHPRRARAAGVGRPSTRRRWPHRLPLDEVAEAFRLARSGEATKRSSSRGWTGQPERQKEERDGHGRPPRRGDLGGEPHRGAAPSIWFPAGWRHRCPSRGPRAPNSPTGAPVRRSCSPPRTPPATRWPSPTRSPLPGTPGAPARDGRRLPQPEGGRRRGDGLGLTVTGTVPGLDQAGFQEAAEAGEQGVPSRTRFGTTSPSRSRPRWTSVRAGPGPSLRRPSAPRRPRSGPGRR